jgi:uncharacterized protein YcfJ
MKKNGGMEKAVRNGVWAVIPPQHRKPARGAAVGSVIGAVVGSMVGGPVGAALGAGVLGAIGAYTTSEDEGGK